MTDKTTEWLQNKLTGRRGEKAEIAAALNMTTVMLSNVLGGRRRLTVEEFDLAKKHFNTKDLIDEPLESQSIPSDVRSATAPLEHNDMRVMQMGDKILVHAVVDQHSVHQLQEMIAKAAQKLSK